MVFLFSSRLKPLRQSMNLAQEQLACLLGVDRSTISSYESNMRQPSLDTLWRIADVFGVSTDYLLGRTNHHLPDHIFDL
ncbi:XRE family transcriptional regulator [Acutalibacter sp. 1XD8-33]|uniref:helix-turn-helix domain-containing protein n=1 Tax=Acutalibacter sp. 1XD8-33 TaxID=2320081 RepID=UPI000EA315AA|nr:helix-turn-helix transcriptional regulator [Acutalibacter sp. 1XD8-33]RKJ41156.1 XRE family transcriptional regulator [Acutalibacter sp. 1XD8-33]